MGRLTCLKPRVGVAPVRRALAAEAPERQAAGRAWRRIRHAIMTRDYGLCRTCNSQGRLTMACDVDHITPVWEGGSDAETNLQALCRPCHKAKSAAEATRRAAGGLAA